ncbi:polysaccharide deacetylase family protein [Streptomyces sp. NBC_01465]|uniref:polysaccharide deacetylase family protein n=1 Tax=Streptomyces sp. NBC_01465 TaxID=2903878 RepID=UPI002E35C0E4|nr:polysaccharide deacetylase family protein [Streptomyces sp. NBC_01465]
MRKFEGHQRKRCLAAGALALATAGVAACGHGGTKPHAHAPRPSDTTAAVDATIAHASERPGKSLNLTFDDGPSPEWTPQILALLKQNRIQATFCMIGPQAKAHPDLVKQVVAEGHRLCDHTVHHDESMDKKSEGYQSAEISDAQKMIEDASGGTAPLYFRAPGGAFDPYNRHVAADHGLRPLGWNADSKDYTRPGVAAIVKTVEDEVSSSSPTVLFHDGGGDRSQTLAALEQLLPWMKQQGYGFGFPQH